MTALPGDWSFETAVRTLWQEARGEPLAGQQAVAHVIWNRLRSGKWGRTLAEVCLSPFQFSGWMEHDPNRMLVARVLEGDPGLVPLREIMKAAQSEDDPTGGATHYYARSIAPPSWVPTMFFCGEFGHQLFYKPKVP